MIDDEAINGGTPGPPGNARSVGVAQDHDRRARAEAAVWYAKLNADQHVSNGDLRAFFAWREDSLNDAAYTRIETLTTGVRALADDPRLRAIAEAAARRPRGIGAALRDLVRKRPTPRATGFGAALAAAMVIGAVLFSQGGQTYRTQVGERRAISLADGSTVELNTDSQVRVRLTKTQRSLTLDRGQAMFAVAHDAERPFIVTAGDTSVRAIGTRFEVYRAQDAVRVTLAEGRVQVSRAVKASAQGPAPGPVTLTAGERVEIGRAKTGAPAPVDVAAVTGWTSGRLTFKDVRLADAVAEVNRYSRRHVVLGQGVPADELVSGVFDAGDTEAFAAGVASSMDLKTTPRADGGVELTGDRPGPA